MKVYKVKIGYMPDSSGGFGFGLMLLFYPVIVAMIASACIYVASVHGAFGENDEEKSEDQT